MFRSGILMGHPQRLGHGVEAPLQDPTLRPASTVASNVARFRNPGLDHTICQPAKLLLPRSEEHTSELQSHSDLVCRLLLEKKKKTYKKNNHKKKKKKQKKK